MRQTKRGVKLALRPSVLISAHKTSVEFLARLIQTPSAQSFLENGRTPRPLEWMDVIDAVNGTNVMLDGLHFLSLGCLENNVRLLTEARNSL